MPSFPVRDRKAYKASAASTGEARAKTVRVRKGAKSGAQKAYPNPLNAAESAAPQGSQAKAENIYARITALKDRYASLLEKDELFEKLYHMEMEDGEGEEGEETVKSSKPFDVVNLATDLLATNVPLVDVPPASESAEDGQDADMTEKFALSMWATWTRRSSEPIIAQMAHYANLLGRHVTRVTYIEDMDGIADKLPVRLQIRNPKYCYPEFDADKQLWGMAECCEHSVGEIRRLLPGVKLPVDEDGDELDDDDMVEWAEWWDAVRCVYFVEGEEVYRLDHDCGRIPYVFGYGRFVPSDKPERRPVSILKGIEHTAAAYDRLLSTELTAVISNVFSAWQFKSERGDTFKPDFSFRAINYIMPNEEFQPLQRQGELADLQGVKATLRDEMDNTTFRAMLGQADASSGYAFSQVTRGEKLKINPVKQSLDVALARIFELALYLIGRGNKSVKLYVPRLPGISDYGYSGFAEMTPARARKHPQVYVSIPPDYLQDQQANVALALQATAGANPLLDRDTARRVYLQQTDSTHIEQKIIEDELTKQALPVWFNNYLLPRLGVQPPAPAGQGGQQQMQPNNGQPITTPSTPYVPDSTAGVPPLAAGDTGNADAMSMLMGQGLPPDMSSQLMASMGTPQSSGQGR